MQKMHLINMQPLKGFAKLIDEYDTNLTAYLTQVELIKMLSLNGNGSCASNEVILNNRKLIKKQLDKAIRSLDKLITVMVNIISNRLYYHQKIDVKLQEKFEAYCIWKHDEIRNVIEVLKKSRFIKNKSKVFLEQLEIKFEKFLDIDYKNYYKVTIFEHIKRLSEINVYKINDDIEEKIENCITSLLDLINIVQGDTVAEKTTAESKGKSRARNKLNRYYYSLLFPVNFGIETTLVADGVSDPMVPLNKYARLKNIKKFIAKVKQCYIIKIRFEEDESITKNHCETKLAQLAIISSALEQWLPTNSPKSGLLEQSLLVFLEFNKEISDIRASLAQKRLENIYNNNIEQLDCLDTAFTRILGSNRPIQQIDFENIYPYFRNQHNSFTSIDLEAMKFFWIVLAIDERGNYEKAAQWLKENWLLAAGASLATIFIIVSAVELAMGVTALTGVHGLAAHTPVLANLLQTLARTHEHLSTFGKVACVSTSTFALGSSGTVLLVNGLKIHIDRIHRLREKINLFRQMFAAAKVTLGHEISNIRENNKENNRAFRDIMEEFEQVSFHIQGVLQRCLFSSPQRELLTWIQTQLNHHTGIKYTFRLLYSWVLGTDLAEDDKLKLARDLDQIKLFEKMREEAEKLRMGPEKVLAKLKSYSGRNHKDIVDTALDTFFSRKNPISEDDKNFIKPILIYFNTKLIAKGNDFNPYGSLATILREIAAASSGWHWIPVLYNPKAGGFDLYYKDVSSSSDLLPTSLAKKPTLLNEGDIFRLWGISQEKSTGDWLWQQKEISFTQKEMNELVFSSCVGIKPQIEITNKKRSGIQLANEVKTSLKWQQIAGDVYNFIENNYLHQAEFSKRIGYELYVIIFIGDLSSSMLIDDLKKDTKPAIIKACKNYYFYGREEGEWRLKCINNKIYPNNSLPVPNTALAILKSYGSINSPELQIIERLFSAVKLSAFVAPKERPLVYKKIQACRAHDNLATDAFELHLAMTAKVPSSDNLYNYQVFPLLFKHKQAYYFADIVQGQPRLKSFTGLKEGSEDLVILNSINFSYRKILVSSRFKRDVYQLVVGWKNNMLLEIYEACDEIKNDRKRKADMSNSSYSVIKKGFYGKDTFYFKLHSIKGDGNCGFTALGISRTELATILKNASENSEDRLFLREDITNLLFDYTGENFCDIPGILITEELETLRDEYLNVNNELCHLENKKTSIKRQLEELAPNLDDIPIKLNFMASPCGNKTDLVKQFPQQQSHLCHSLTEHLAAIEQEIERCRSKSEEIDASRCNYCQRKDVIANVIAHGLGKTPDIESGESGVWLGLGFIYLYAREAKRSIYVWQVGSGGLLEINDRASHIIEEQPAQHIIFSNGNHYDVLTDITDTYDNGTFHQAPQMLYSIDDTNKSVFHTQLGDNKLKGIDRRSFVLSFKNKILLNNYSLHDLTINYQPEKIDNNHSTTKITISFDDITKQYLAPLILKFFEEAFKECTQFRSEQIYGNAENRYTTNPLMIYHNGTFNHKLIVDLCNDAWKAAKKELATQEVSGVVKGNTQRKTQPPTT